MNNEYMGASTATGVGFHLATPCLICGESVVIGHYRDVPKICNKCKEAIMSVRKQTEKQEAEE